MEEWYLSSIFIVVSLIILQIILQSTSPSVVVAREIVFIDEVWPRISGSPHSRLG
jgi:hypothetical protein